MIRITTLLWIVLLVVAGGTDMRVSYQVRHAEKHLAQLASDTRQEQDAIRILTAEWDTLNDPQRIDALSKRYLTLESTPIQRVVALDAVPFKPTEEQLAQLAAAAGKNAKKGLTTASAKAATMTPAKAPVPAEPASRVVALPVTTAAASYNGNGGGGVGLILTRLERRE